MKIRVEVLGEGALPQAPRPAPMKPPLAMMSRQRPQERATLEVESERRHLLTARTAVGACVLAGLVGVALVATVSLVVAVAVVGAALVAILAVVVGVAGLPQLRGARRARGSRSTRHSALSAKPGGGGTDGDPLGKIRVQAEQLRRLAAEPEDAPFEIEPAGGVDADQRHDLELPGSTASAEPTVLPDVAIAPPDDIARELRPSSRQQASEGQSFKDQGHDQFAQIKRQAERFRRIAESQGEVEPDVAQGDATQNDPDQLAKIKQQTERLKSIAAKFNAAKGEAKPDS